MAYERYVVDELAPWIRHDCRNAEIRLMTSGVSLGAYYAANFALKFPNVFHYALCLSGRYDVTWMTDGFSSTDVYFNNPIAYVPNLHGEHLEDVRRNVHVTLVCGQGKWEDGNIEDTMRLADALGAKGIRHDRDLWGYDVAHEWAWWRRQVRFHLDRVLPQLNA
jgi:esterase/lipase superfamily enzyme